MGGMLAPVVEGGSRWESWYQGGRTDKDAGHAKLTGQSHVPQIHVTAAWHDCIEQMSSFVVS